MFRILKLVELKRVVKKANDPLSGSNAKYHTCKYNQSLQKKNKKNIIIHIAKICHILTIKII